MPRPKTSVKTKVHTPAVVDLHFHGAFGLDFMVAEAPDADALARELGRRGLGGFLATTLSAKRPELLRTVTRLGHWIRTSKAHVDPTLARPLGIHLEGPFIAKNACGAHPQGALRPATLDELDALWGASLGTLRLITLAPEIHSKPMLSAIASWARQRKIRLSLGHSSATADTATRALNAGFSGITHAWNAMRFHQREPGILGAALGRPDTHVELILDGVHVAPQVVRWTRDLHGQGTCYVSDCAPAAGLRAGRGATFGPLRVQVRDGACRTRDGHLAGGAKLLPEAIRAWLELECLTRPRSAWASVLRRELWHATGAPLEALRLDLRALQGRRLQWRLTPTRIDFTGVGG